MVSSMGVLMLAFCYSVEAFDATVLAALAAVTAGSDDSLALRAALIDASVHECAAFAAYACELAATRAKRGGEGGG